MPNRSHSRSRTALARAEDSRLRALVVTVGLLSGLALLLSVSAAWLPAT